MAKTLIAVVGPTAIGKTALSIKLANHYNTEIVSADSRQFYKEMTIGTAVPSKEELSAAKHHFIQNLSVTEDYSVGDFERDGLALLDKLFKVQDIVILVGGSGLYVDAIVKGLNHFPDVDESIRLKLNDNLKNEGLEPLQNQLKTLDPKYFEKVDIHNPHRVIRALEICIGTQKTYTSFLEQDKEERPFNTITIGLEADRTKIYERINDRVDIMMAEGLLKEVKSLEPYKNYNALNTVGYKELFNYLDDEWSLEFAISEIKKNTRRFAKRQLTWFKKNSDTLWFNYKTAEQTIIKVIDNKMQSQ
ncbi:MULTISPECIES: tRNA (adenosine(37)-N6)-dimethylallyltransferase MiaA [Croceibacter]|uniref:tRNA (adenosine(37)-N6)-dimethylallyltransferase MiaA n=1 Tax=Croceibacter TaxID=216431 RepID=UPI000C6BDC7E|nr:MULTISPECIES: tRNA (adenosine(37)-N6)-dimethylallyltransferase MiaA [Croceibacter]MBG26939.1 tRNA (adenosine(37)-N6)-dimethylallyltransferase MiaA [Croceibacter sp.]HAT70995.1 tRNA (adenosine(37)-N6)-dimethylallyltransferase MiaA [Flavobacteriaceae bacterium]|tara:strand:+ start:6938 stop:7849 length:912 start_codon:yes stop_codon:yes gene_type:complete